MSINPTTGVIAGTLAAGSARGQAYAVTVTAGDGSQSASVSFNWTVATLVVTAPADRSDDTVAAVSVPVLAQSSSGAALTYSTSGLPPGLSINPSTGVISGTLAPNAATRRLMR